MSTSILILSKNATTPALPGTDKIGVYVDSNELLAFIIDSGVVRNIPQWIVPTAFTPGISFGGGTTGITYGAQVANCERLGNRFYFSGYVLLTSKGSSTGTALITGLPAASKNTTNYFHAVTLRVDNMTGVSGMIQGLILANSQTISLSYSGTGTATTIDNTHFANNTGIAFMGHYEV